MEGRGGITDETLECMKRGFHRTLKTLVVHAWSCAAQLTEKEFLSACRALTNLNNLCIEDGDSLTKGCIEQLVDIFGSMSLGTGKFGLERMTFSRSLQG